MESALYTFSCVHKQRSLQVDYSATFYCMLDLSCFRNPPNFDMNYTVFNKHMHVDTDNG